MNFETLKQLVEIARRAIHYKFCQVVAAVLKDQEVPWQEDIPSILEKAREIHRLCSQRFGITGGFKPNHQQIDALLQPAEMALKNSDKLTFLYAAGGIASTFKIQLDDELLRQDPRLSGRTYEKAYLGAAVTQFQIEGLVLSKILTAYTLERRRCNERKPTEQPTEPRLQPSAVAAELPHAVDQLIDFASQELRKHLWILAAEILDDGDISPVLETARNLHLELSHSLPPALKGPTHRALGEMMEPLEATIRTGDKLGFLAEIRGIAAIFQTPAPQEQSKTPTGSEEDAQRQRALQDMTTALWFQTEVLIFARLLTAFALWGRKQHRSPNG